MSSDSSGIASISSDATLTGRIRAIAQLQPEAVALEFEGRRTDFATFERHTDQVAGALLAAGLKAGSRLAYVGKNSDIFFELMFGAIKAGMVLVPVGWRLAPPEIAHIIEHSEAELLFAGNESLAAVQKIAASLLRLRGIIALEAEAPADWRVYPVWRDAAPAIPCPYICQPHDVALQLYTSGTTGRPKGVMLTHDNWLTSVRLGDGPETPWMHWTRDDVSLIAMPLSHIAGVGWGLHSLIEGARGIVMRDFDPHRLLDLIEQEHISKMLVVPAALRIMLANPRCRQVDFSRLKYLLYGASPIPDALLRESIDVIGCGFVQAYGMTETGGTVSALTPADHADQASPRMRSVGRAMPWAEVAVVGVDGRPLPVGEVGEIVARTAQNMAGYWRAPEETAGRLMPMAGCIQAMRAIWMKMATCTCTIASRI